MSIDSDPETFIRAHQRGLQGYLRLLGATATEAEDLAQEAFLAALAKGRAGAADAAWLRGAARKLWLARVRRERRRSEILRCDAADVLWERLALDREDGVDDYLDALSQCLEELAPRARSMIDRHYRGGESGPEIARALGLTAAAVNVAMHRARAGLHVCIERRVAR